MKQASTLLALPLALSFVGGNTGATEAAGGGQCEIRTVESAGELHVQAVAHSLGMSGEYELEVMKTGGGGTSNSSQSGEFEASDGGETILSEVTIGGGGSVKARLTLWSDAGDIVCTAKFPDRS